MALLNYQGGLNIHGKTSFCFETYTDVSGGVSKYKKKISEVTVIIN